MRLTAAILALALAAPALATEPGHRLLMVEQPGCPYCRLFDRDLAPIYPLSPEGRAAPLVRVQLRGPYPQGVTLASPPIATPTFILIGPDGAEIDRITGYLGADFFWAYLGRMFERAGVEIEAAAAD